MSQKQWQVEFPRGVVLPCIACGKVCENAGGETAFNQPYQGTAFYTAGHYGSTFIDMDGVTIEITVCDECLRKYPDRIAEQPPRAVLADDGSVILRPRRRRPRPEDIATRRQAGSE